MAQDLRACFRTLGLEPGASLDEIKRAYRQLLQRWHPDHYKPGSLMQTTAEDITKEVNEAYNQLCRKKRYLEFIPRTPKRPKTEPAPPPTRPEPAPEKKPAPPPPPQPEAARPPPEPPRSPRPPETAPPPPPRPKRTRAAGALRAKIVTMARRAFRHTTTVSALAALAAAVWLVIRIWPVGPRVDFPAQATLVATHTASAAALDSANSAVRPAARSMAVATTAPTARAPSPVAAAAFAIPLPIADAPAFPPASSRHAENDSFQRPASQPILPPDLVSLPRAPAVPLDAGSPASPRGQLAAPPVTKLEPSVLLDEALGLLATFNLGDTRERVLFIQGTPDDAGEDIIRYGSSLVYFREGRVIRWRDGRPSLRVFALPKFEAGGLATFAVGATRTEVVHVQGPPTAIVGATYFYGASAVYFDREWVVGWHEVDVPLRTRSLPTIGLGGRAGFAGW